jgi:hypothetical protein
MAAIPLTFGPGPVLDISELALIILSLVFFSRAGLSQRFPAVRNYLAIRLATVCVLLPILYLHHFVAISARVQYEIYFYASWPSYIACAIAVFFVVQEIFKLVMEPVAGLQRIGLVAFRWVAALALIIATASLTIPFKSISHNLAPFGMQVLRCISLFELALLAFLAISIHSLGRSFRSRAFGIALGLGVQASIDMILSMLQSYHPGLNSWVNVLSQATSISVLVLWSGYFLASEPVAELNPVTLPVSSSLLRWNDIAMAMGHSNAYVTVGQTSGAFFLRDVEQVVDKVLTKNSVGV